MSISALCCFQESSSLDCWRLQYLRVKPRHSPIQTPRINIRVHVPSVRQAMTREEEKEEERRKKKKKIHACMCTFGHCRRLRFEVFSTTWLQLWMFSVAIHGVCLSVFVLGDLQIDAQIKFLTWLIAVSQCLNQDYSQLFTLFTILNQMIHILIAVTKYVRYFKLSQKMLNMSAFLYNSSCFKNLGKIELSMKKKQQKKLCVDETLHF